MKLNIVPARTGIAWVKLGIRTFFRQPLALAGLFFMFFMVFVLLSSLPVVGPIAAVVLMPGATLGMMAATRQASEGRFPMPSVLISAFRAGRQRLRGMLVLGVIYVLVLITLVLAVSPFLGGDAGTEAPAATVDAAVSRIRPGLFIYMLLQLPLVVLFAHAPALVHWHGIGPVKSLFFSAIAFWRNLGAFAVFGASWLVFLLALGLVLSLVFAAFDSQPGYEAMIPVALMAMSIMSTSMYFTFRDCFVATPQDNPEQPPLDPTTGEDR